MFIAQVSAPRYAAELNRKSEPTARPAVAQFGELQFLVVVFVLYTPYQLLQDIFKGYQAHNLACTV